jgi:hypothetical protein
LPLKILVHFLALWKIHISDILETLYSLSLPKTHIYFNIFQILKQEFENFEFMKNSTSSDLKQTCFNASSDILMRHEWQDISQLIYHETLFQEKNPCPLTIQKQWNFWVMQSRKSLGVSQELQRLQLDLSISWNESSWERLKFWRTQGDKNL